MGTKLNRNGYENLINEDIIWLLENAPRSLERDHIEEVLKSSVDLLYQKSSNRICELEHATQQPNAVDADSSCERCKVNATGTDNKYCRDCGRKLRTTD